MRKSLVLHEDNLTPIGLPRTGTNSFCAALEILLNGPPYHTGVQTSLGRDTNDTQTWIDVVEARPYKSAKDKENALAQMAKVLDGFVATADPPLSQLVPELMELYPDAKVICTVRDVEGWVNSMEMLTKTVKPGMFRVIFFWMGAHFRRLPVLWSLLTKIFTERYGVTTRTRADSYKVWEQHHAWLEQVVPKDKLFYFNVKDGWEPLCKALDVPVPKDQPFPRLNDAKAFGNVFEDWAKQGLLRWAAAVGVGAVSIGVAAAVWTKV